MRGVASEQELLAVGPTSATDDGNREQGPVGHLLDGPREAGQEVGEFAPQQVCKPSGVARCLPGAVLCHERAVEAPVAPRETGDEEGLPREDVDGRDAVGVAGWEREAELRVAPRRNPLGKVDLGRTDERCAHLRRDAVRTDDEVELFMREAAVGGARDDGGTANIDICDGSAEPGRQARLGNARASTVAASVWRSIEALRQVGSG